MNNCTFVGQVCSEPQSHTGGSTARASVRIKTLRSYQGNEYADFIPLTGWGQTAAKITQLVEGQWVSVQGRYSSRKVEDKVYTDINVRELEVLAGMNPDVNPNVPDEGTDDGSLPF